MVKTLEVIDMLEALPEDVGLSSSRLGNVSRLVQGYVDERKFPGAITMIARRGKIVFGLGFAVLLDPTVAQIIGTPGEYYWGGASSTAFFVSPAEDLVTVFLTQLSPSSSYPIRRELRAATYGAIID